ncbi:MULTISPECIES: hypothetical protein [unclassified Chryseobacterium]|uniref:hypothetical protein n=1 Tax=unclassified Chryseobacterium TaxID=2593645 RepID=UPI000F45A474|nr:hypothetical protein [Chryseobacterium sp. G0240]ROI01209.1 hypothetical protein EGI16_18685 [Chryseobacterium sp. G0240]
MTTTDIKEHIIPYIGETLPYISIPDHIIFREHKMETEIFGQDFSNENFANLIKKLASLGSLSLYKLLNDTSKEKIYFLGEKVRIRKLSYKTSDAISVTSESILESKRKGRSLLMIKDIHSGEALYSFEMDYYIITQDSFQLFYQDYFSSSPVEDYDKSLPESRINPTNDRHQFTISIMPFSPNQCKGHFENYPIVPFVFITNCILKEIFAFLGNERNYEVDSLEGYASIAVPTGKELLIEVFHQKLLKNLIYFKCEFKDHSGTSYGALITNIKAI